MPKLIVIRDKKLHVSGKSFHANINKSILSIILRIYKYLPPNIKNSPYETVSSILFLSQGLSRILTIVNKRNWDDSKINDFIFKYLQSKGINEYKVVEDFTPEIKGDSVILAKYVGVDQDGYDVVLTLESKLSGDQEGVWIMLSIGGNADQPVKLNIP